MEGVLVFYGGGLIEKLADVFGYLELGVLDWWNYVLENYSDVVDDLFVFL